MQRLVLFDIDGTLLTARPAPRVAFERAMLEVYGETGAIATHAFDGKTDPQIARELLSDAGLDDATIEGRLALLWSAYIRELQQELALPGHRTHVYPGVHALLDALEARAEDVVLGLLTGNIRDGATLKLSSAQIRTTFRVGAFGSDCEQRSGLPPIAVERAERETGVLFHGSDVVIIGDTPMDMRCGGGLGVRAIGVTTGHHDRPTLENAGAAHVLDDFSNTHDAIDAILAGP